MLVTSSDVALVHSKDKEEVWFQRVAHSMAVLHAQLFACDNGPISVLSRAVCAHFLSEHIASCDVQLRGPLPEKPASVDVIQCLAEVVVPGSAAVVCPVVASTMRLLPGPCECMFTMPGIASGSFRVERVPDARVTLRHWAIILDVDSGAPAAAFETMLDVLLHMLSGPRAVSVAARCCSVAKGLVYFSSVLNNATNDASQAVYSDAIFAAAAALDVGVGALDALRSSLSKPDDRTAFLSWAVHSWIAYLEGEVNASLCHTRMGFGPTKRLLVSWDGMGGGLLASAQPLQSEGCLSAALMEVIEHALRGTSARGAWYAALKRRTTDPWMQVLDVHRAGLFEMPAHRSVVVRGDDTVAVHPTMLHTWRPVEDTMLPCAFVRLVTSALPLLAHCGYLDDAVAVGDADADEGCAAPSLLLTGPLSAASLPTVFSSYRLLKLSSKLRLLLITLRLRFSEYGDDDVDSTVIQQQVDVLLHQRSCLLRFVGCSTLVPWIFLVAEASRTRIHAPLLQAALRARRSAINVVAPKRMKHLSHHATVIQGFLRSHAAMRETCHRDFFATLASADVGAAPSLLSTGVHWNGHAQRGHWNSNSAVVVQEPRRFALAAPSRQCRALQDATQSMEARFRRLIVEDEHAVRTCSIATTVAQWFPLWKVAQDEAGIRIAMTELEGAHFTPIVVQEEDGLRQRVQFLEARAWCHVLGRTIEIRQRLLLRQEDSERTNIERAFDAQHREWGENVALMNHLESLAELRSGAALRQAVQRERSRVELPFRRSDPFVRDPASGSIESPIATLSVAQPIETAAHVAAFSRQRERFLTNVLEEIAVLLAEERQMRDVLIKKIVLEELRGREGAERVTIAKQYAFHWARLCTSEQRMRLWAVERRHRSILCTGWRCGYDEMLHRRRITLHEQSLREILVQVADLERHHRQEAADEWTAVRSDRYASPAVLLAELQREQRDVQRLLASMAASDAVQRRSMQARLRKGGDVAHSTNAGHTKSPINRH